MWLSLVVTGKPLGSERRLFGSPSSWPCVEQSLMDELGSG